MSSIEPGQVCAGCRETQQNRAWVLRALGHDECKAAIRAEVLAARRFGVRFHPSGCATGSCVAGQFDTTEKVHKEFTSKAKERMRELSEGWRHELLSHEEWKQRAEPCLLGECEHEVTWQVASNG